ncbi:MAG TPA: hypothetical protein VF530_09770 [Planctomycetota bacterium]
MTVWLALALLVPSQNPVAPAAAQQGEESVLVTHDLRALLPRWDAGAGWSQSLLVAPIASPSKELASVEDSLQYGELAAFEVQDLLGQILGDDLRREGRDLMVDGHTLTVLAPPAQQEQVRAVLEALGSVMGATASVRVDVLTLGEGGGEAVPAGVISEEEAARLVTTLVGRGAKHESATLELSTGRTAAFDAQRTIPFLFDYDVEIAQGILVFEPVMARTREGLCLVLRGAGVPGGLRLSSVCVRSERLGEIGELELRLSGLVNQGEGEGAQPLEGPSTVQSPDLRVSAFAFDTFLPDGKALALTLETNLGAVRARELVLLRRAGGALGSYVARPVPRTSRTLIALDAGLFRPARLASWIEWDDDAERGLRPVLSTTLDGELSGFLLQWLKARFSVWRRFGPWILIVTDPAWDRDAAAQLERLVKAQRAPAGPRTLALDLRVGSSVPVRARLPVLDGSSVGLVQARGRTAVLGYRVEVAQGAAAPDPSVDSVFEGLAVTLELQGPVLSARGLVQLLDGPPGVLDPRYPVIGPIQRFEARRLRFDERFVLPEGRPGPVFVGGNAERGEGLVLELSVTGAAR